VQDIKVAIQNNVDGSIAGVSGEMKFIDIFDKEVGAVNFRISETIQPNKSIIWSRERTTTSS